MKKSFTIILGCLTGLLCVGAVGGIAGAILPKRNVDLHEHNFEAGICVDCGYHCEHEWNNGICDRCSFECEHELSIVPGQIPTSAINGWHDCYHCDICGLYFEDSDFSNPFSNFDEWKVGRGAYYKRNVLPIPTSSSSGWEYSAYSPARIDFNSSIDDHNGCAQFRNYQYYDWGEEKMGIVSKYSVPIDRRVSVNHFSFDYYLLRDDNGTGIKADLTVNLFVIDNQEHTTLISHFVIDKNDDSSWVHFEKGFNLTNCSYFVVETKGEFVELPQNKGINNQFYLNNIELCYLGV